MSKIESLYGLKNTNRKRAYSCGKEPIILSFLILSACYMRDNKMNPIYLYLDKDLKVHAKEVSFDFVFNTTLKNSDSEFQFEKKYEPYQQYAYDDIKGIYF
ncbi:HindVP family restriction endonuclease [Escherichia coli]